MKRFHLLLAILASLLFVAFCWIGEPVVGFLLLTGASLALNQRDATRFCAVTLSVPEILNEILTAFKVETPEIFGPAGFSQDFKSSTAVIGDKVTAHIAHVPTTGAYDKNNGGFKAAAQDVTTLIEDVPVTLNQFRIVTVNLSWLTGLQSKVDLFKAAIANMGFSLGKYVVDQVLTTAVTGAVSNSLTMNSALTTLDTFDGDIRNQCNAQKMHGGSRFCFLNGKLAAALGADDRVRSELFYGQKNGEEGYRLWKNLAGFNWVREYTDFPAAGINAAGLAGDHRLAVICVRQVEDINKVAKEAGVPTVMDFHQVVDKESNLPMTAVTWQEQGTGDIYLSAGILFGVGVGNQGGAVGTMTDNAGLVLKTTN